MINRKPSVVTYLALAILQTHGGTTTHSTWANTEPLSTPSTTPSEEPSSEQAPEISRSHAAPASPAPRRQKKSLVIDIDSLRPQLGLQLFASPNVLNNAKTEQYFVQKGFAGDPVVSAIGLMADYQPAFLQVLGVFDLGATIAIHPIFPSPNPYVNSIASNYTLGLQAKYQLRFFSGQFLVPVVGYFADAFFYAFNQPNSPSTVTQGRTVIQGPLLGAWLLLNWMEPSVARDYFVDSGASRTYLTFEARKMVSNEPSLPINGFTYLFGLRSEF